MKNNTLTIDLNYSDGYIFGKGWHLKFQGSVFRNSGFSFYQSA